MFFVKASQPKTFEEAHLKALHYENLLATFDASPHMGFHQLIVNFHIELTLRVSPTTEMICLAGFR